MGMPPMDPTNIMNSLTGSNSTKEELHQLIDKLKEEESIRKEIDEYQEPEFFPSEYAEKLRTIENPKYADEEIICFNAYADTMNIFICYVPDKLRVKVSSLNDYIKFIDTQYDEKDLLISQMKQDMCYTLHPKYLTIEYENIEESRGDQPIALTNSSSLVVYSRPEYRDIETKKQMSFLSL